MADTEQEATETVIADAAAATTPADEAAVAPVAKAASPERVAEETPVLRDTPAPKAVTETKRGPGRPRKAAAAKAKPAAANAPKNLKPAPAKAPKPVAAKQATKASAPQKETVKMATKTTDFTAKFQESFKDSAEKAKAAFGDAGEFAKGNVEAVVASAKILGAGMKNMGEAYVAESKSAYEIMAADLKELAAVKSPTEFFELQARLFRKNFDAAVATSSKKSEEALKLANEAFQPLSTRFSLAIEKFKQAA